MQENFGGKKLWQISTKGKLAKIFWQIHPICRFDLKCNVSKGLLHVCVGVKMAIFKFSVEGMIHRYHEYMRIWKNLSPTNHLLCQQQIGNPHNTHAVAVKENITGVDSTTTVEHVLKKISAICSLEVVEISIMLLMVSVVFLQTCCKVDLKYPVS